MSTAQYVGQRCRAERDMFHELNTWHKGEVYSAPAELPCVGTTSAAFNEEHPDGCRSSLDDHLAPVLKYDPARGAQVRSGQAVRLLGDLDAAGRARRLGARRHVHCVAKEAETATDLADNA